MLAQLHIRIGSVAKSALEAMEFCSSTRVDHGIKLKEGMQLQDLAGKLQPHIIAAKDVMQSVPKDCESLGFAVFEADMLNFDADIDHDRKLLQAIVEGCEGAIDNSFFLFLYKEKHWTYSAG